MRTFPTGATRDTAQGKPDYVGYLSPTALTAYGRYMLKHQTQADGTVRDAGNWKKGMPLDVYLASAMRHLHAVWLHHEGHGKMALEPLEDALCALWFNVQGYLHEHLKAGGAA